MYDGDNRALSVNCHVTLILEHSIILIGLCRTFSLALTKYSLNASRRTIKPFSTLVPSWCYSVVPFQVRVISQYILTLVGHCIPMIFNSNKWTCDKAVFHSKTLKQTAWVWKKIFFKYLMSHILRWSHRADLAMFTLPQYWATCRIFPASSIAAQTL